MYISTMRSPAALQRQRIGPIELGGILQHTLDPRVEIDPMEIHRISAFSDSGSGGNPVGVAIVRSMPTKECMQSIAADVGYSGTVFACQEEDTWRVRYFSPETEVPFLRACHHCPGCVACEADGQSGLQAATERHPDHRRGDIFRRTGKWCISIAKDVYRRTVFSPCCGNIGLL